MTDRLEQLQKLYEAEPSDPFVTYGMALEHAKLGDTDAALRWLDQTLSIDANYCYAYFQKGRLLADQGQADAAKQAIEQGIERAQQAGDAHAAGELRELLASIS